MAHPPSGLVEENKYRQSVLDCQGIQPIGHSAYLLAILPPPLGVAWVKYGEWKAERDWLKAQREMFTKERPPPPVTPIPPTVAPPDVLPP